MCVAQKRAINSRSKVAEQEERAVAAGDGVPSLRTGVAREPARAEPNTALCPFPQAAGTEGHELGSSLSDGPRGHKSTRLPWGDPSLSLLAAGGAGHPWCRHLLTHQSNLLCSHGLSLGLFPSSSLCRSVSKSPLCIRLPVLLDWAHSMPQFNLTTTKQTLFPNTVTFAVTRD